MTIDLHGMTEQEAIPYILSSLFSLDMNQFETYLEIITGKGQGVLLRTTLDLLEEENRVYSFKNNRIIVYKRSKDEQDDFYDEDDILSQWNKMKEE